VACHHDERTPRMLRRTAWNPAAKRRHRRTSVNNESSVKNLYSDLGGVFGRN